MHNHDPFDNHDPGDEHVRTETSNNKISVEEATVEQLLSDVSYWEDPDQTLLMSPLDDHGNGVSLMDYEGRNYVEAPTLKEALIKFYVKTNCKLEDDSDGISRSGFIFYEDEIESNTCDWVTYLRNNETKYGLDFIVVK